MGLVDSLPDRYLPRDPISGNFLILEPEHGAVHDGQHFTASHYVSVGTATAVTVLVTTPSSATYIHFIAKVTSDKGGVWTMSEAPVTSGGTVLPSYNNDRNSALTDPVTLAHTVTVNAASVGTVLQSGIIGASGNPNSTAGGEGKHDNEWVLKRDSTYLIRFVAGGAATQVVMTLPYYYREVG